MVKKFKINAKAMTAKIKSLVTVNKIALAITGCAAVLCVTQAAQANDFNARRIARNKVVTGMPINLKPKVCITVIPSNEEYYGYNGIINKQPEGRRPNHFGKYSPQEYNP